MKKRTENQSPAKRFARCLMGLSFEIHRGVIKGDTTKGDTTIAEVNFLVEPIFRTVVAE